MSDEEKIKAQEDITARMDQPAMAREMRYLARDRDESSPGRTLRERSRERSVSVGECCFGWDWCDFDVRFKTLILRIDFVFEISTNWAILMTDDRR